MKDHFIELIAAHVYDAMQFDLENPHPEWVEFGNSQAQGFARDTARNIINAIDGGGKVMIRMDIEKARSIQSGIADVLCWIRGFCAAYQGDFPPFNVDKVQEVNAAFQDAIDQVEGLK